MRRFLFRIITLAIPQGNRLINRCYSLIFSFNKCLFCIKRVADNYDRTSDAYQHNVQTNGCRADSMLSAIHDLKQGSVTFLVLKAKQFNYAFSRVTT